MGYEFEQLFLVAAAEDGDFVLGFLVQPHFDDCPDSSEHHRSIHNEHPSSLG